MGDTGVKYECPTTRHFATLCEIQYSRVKLHITFSWRSFEEGIVAKEGWKGRSFNTRHGSSSKRNVREFVLQETVMENLSHLARNKNSHFSLRAQRVELANMCPVWCAKQLQTVRSRITCFRVVFAIPGSYLFHFLSYRFETRHYCFYTYKECLCRFSTAKMGTLSPFRFLAASSCRYSSIVRPWLVHRDLPEIPPKHKSLVYILCLSALAECGYSHGPYYVYEKQLSFVLTARNTISILFFLKLFSSS